MSEIERAKIALSSEGQEAERDHPNRIRFEVWGEEMIEKEVKRSASSGRVYLPPGWVGQKVKIIRID